MSIKITKKLDLFEAFKRKSNMSEVKVDVINGSMDPITSIKVEVDNIISGLNSLVNGLGEDSTNESETINEGSDPIDQIISSDITAIPMLVAGGSLLGIAGLIKYIKNIKKKKKIKGMYQPAHKSKITAAQMDVKLSEIDLGKIEKDQREKVRKQIDAFKEKRDSLIRDAEEVESTIAEAFPDNDDILALLKAETRIAVAEIKLSGNLSDSERAKMEEMLENARKTVENQLEKNEEKSKEIEEKGNSTPNKEKIERFEGMIDEVKKQKENLNKEDEDYQENVETLDKQIESFKDRIEKLKGEESKDKPENAEGNKEEAPDSESKPDTAPSDEESTESEEVKKHKEKIAEYEKIIDELKTKKDKKSSDQLDIVQAALKSEKQKLDKAQSKTSESFYFKTSSISQRFRDLM
jgi:hypothetical protein